MDVNRKIRISRGVLLSIAVVMIPAIAWVPSYDFSGLGLPVALVVTIAKVSAFSGMAMFAWSLILSGRYKLFDSWFNGLDKVYIAHRFFGTASMAMLLLHPIALTIARLPERGSAALSIWTNLGSTGLLLGMISLYGLLFVASWSIVARVRHETFVTIHRWLGVLFIAGAIHALMLGSVLATNQFMYIYTLTLSIVATLTFIHYSLLSDVLHAFYRYRLSTIRLLPGDVLDIRLQPSYRILKHQPGQFAYLSFDGFNGESYHPFTIASGNRSGELRFLVKLLGDHTTAMQQLKAGQPAKVKGPYGGFTFHDARHDKQLWIAGGIGVTPFLSKAQSIAPTQVTPHITMLYCVRTEAEAVAGRELFALSNRLRCFDFRIIDEETFGRLSLHNIAEQLGGLHDTSIYLCGPPPMLQAYQQEADKLGLTKQLYFEEFGY
jgi:predicted ferric reductase